MVYVYNNIPDFNIEKQHKNIFSPVLASKFKLNESVNEKYKFDPL